MEKERKAKKDREKARKAVLILLGTLAMGLGVNIVYEPMKLVPGGVSGLAILVKEWTQGIVPVWVTNLACNIPLFLVAWKKRGSGFMKRSLAANLCFTGWMAVIPVVSIPQPDFLIATLAGGVLTGAGLGLIFSTDTSTGGTDLLGTILHQKFRHYSVAQLLFMVDGIVVILGAAVFGIRNACYALLAILVSTKVTDRLLEGPKTAKMAYIISEEYEAVAKQILTEMDRGVTGLESEGMYSNRKRKMLCCVVSKKEIVKIKDITARIDPSAFIIILDAREVMGEGFYPVSQQ